LLEAPCELVPKAALAELFGIPADDIKQHSMQILGAMCTAKWKDDTHTFEMDMRLQVFTDVEQAQQRFARSTRSTTPEELAAATAALQKQMGEDEQASATEKKMTKGLLGALAKQRTEYEDVAEVGDEARF